MLASMAVWGLSNVESVAENLLRLALFIKAAAKPCLKGGATNPKSTIAST
jgi:hypothetical protein